MIINIPAKQISLYSLLKSFNSMKHTLKITIVLVLLFFISQVIGLTVTGKYLGREKIVTPEGK